MKKLIFGLTLALGLSASAAQAGMTVEIDGTEYPLVALMDNCGNASGGDEARLACFSALTKLLKDQNTDPKVALSITQALEELKAAAQHQDDESGLSIDGNECLVTIVYFNNFFHISRRNVSTIDLFSAKFDASKMQYDQTKQVNGSSMTWSKGLMELGATAVSTGGLALDSKQKGFSPKPANKTLSDYAKSVADELTKKEEQTFDFVLVHPSRKQDSAKIWDAFETFVSACKS